MAFILAQTASAQDACTADFGTHVGSPACPYQWVGATSITFDGRGDIGSGTLLGFVGMTTQCRADFGAGARMCTSAEILNSDSLNFNAIPAGGCWLRPSWALAAGSVAVDESGYSAGPSGLACLGWNGVGQGLHLKDTGSIDQTGCTTILPVACCKPTPVPAPTSSLTLPIGAAALAGLSMLKGGA